MNIDRGYRHVEVMKRQENLLFQVVLVGVRERTVSHYSISTRRYLLCQGNVMLVIEITGTLSV